MAFFGQAKPAGAPAAAAAPGAPRDSMSQYPPNPATAGLRGADRPGMQYRRDRRQMQAAGVQPQPFAPPAADGATTGQNVVGPWATAQPDIGAGPTAENPITAYMRPDNVFQSLGAGLGTPSYAPPPDRGQQLDAYRGWLQARNDGGPMSMDYRMPPEWMNAQRAQRMQERIAGRNQQPQKGGQPAQMGMPTPLGA